MEYTMHSLKQMKDREITERMVIAIVRKGRTKMQFTDDGIEVVHWLNWNGAGNLYVVTDSEREIVITAKWERYSENWHRYDHSEDKAKYGIIRPFGRTA